MMQDELTLDNVCSGSLVEQFDREVREVVRNMADPNTDPEERRKILIEVIFRPFKDRSGAQVTVSAHSKLAAMEPAAGQIFVGKGVGGGATAFNYDPKQEQLRFQDAPGPAQ